MRINLKAKKAALGRVRKSGQFREMIKSVTESCGRIEGKPEKQMIL